MTNTPSKAVEYYAGALVLMALTMGGGTVQGLWSDHFLQLASVPAILLGFPYLVDRSVPISLRVLIVFVLLVLVLQFLPWPRSWPPDPAYKNFDTILFSAAPHRSFESAVFVITALSWFLLFWRLSPEQLTKLSKFLLLGVALNVMAGLFQLSQGQRILPQVGLPYRLGAGLFANENHFSTLIFMMIPFFSLIFLHARVNVLLYVFISIFMMIVIFAIGSQAGIFIGSTIVLYCFFWFGYLRGRPYLKIVIALMVASVFVVLAFVTQSTLLGELQSRLVFAKATFEAIGVFWPLGSGLGSFPYVYPMFEPVSEVSTTYAQRAHNDYLQIALEAGLTGIVALCIFIAMLFKRFTKSMVGQAAFLSILLVLMHSLIDYPLRTFAIAMMFSYASCLVFRSSEFDMSSDHTP